MKALMSLALVLGLVSVAQAGELDTVPSAKPAGVLVKVDPQTKTVSVYKASEIDSRLLNKSVEKLSDAEKLNLTEDAVAKIARPENLVGQLQANAELDREASTSAWYRRGWGAGWGWSGWGGYSYGYRYSTYSWNRPYYNPGRFYYGGYNYNYGWNYGYNNCNYGWYW